MASLGLIKNGHKEKLGVMPGTYPANRVNYNNNESGISATNVQDAIDELASGGGGGHVIEDTDGTDMPQEENLQFVGLKVTDDSTNGKTIVDATDKVTWEANGVLGAKNLIPYPYYETTKTVNGITFTDNGDGSVTVSGTATAFASFISHNRQNSEVNEFRVKNGSYILSGCPNGGSEDTFYLLGNRTYNGSNNSLGKDVGNGVTLTLNGDDYGADGVNLGIIIEVKSGTSIPTPITFYPMLRLASDTDGTYQPYARTNNQLTDDVKDVWKANGRLGAKNLVPYPFFNPNPTYTNNGVTFTDNGDGTITANGTASSSANASCHFIARLGSNYKLPLGKYILTGCPEGGSSTTYRIGVNRTVNGSPSTYGNDYGIGFIFEVTDDTATTGCFIDIIKGATVNNVVFKPMIRLALDLDDTYQPYAKTNKQLTDDKVEYDTMNIVGAKNLIPYPHVRDSSTGDFGSTLSATYNADGTVTVSGTVSQDSRWYLTTLSDKFNLLNGDYIISDGLSSIDSQVYLEMALYNGTTYTGTGHNTRNAGFKKFTLTDTPTRTALAIYVLIRAGATLPVTFKPMIRPASYLDDTYEPYAKTNQQLTKDVNSKQNASDNSLNTTNKTVVGAINEVNNGLSTLTTKLGNYLSVVTYSKTVTISANTSGMLKEDISSIIPSGKVPIGIVGCSFDGNASFGTNEIIVENGVYKYHGIVTNHTSSAITGEWKVYILCAG